ncbi:hypothetical protein, partial [Lacimicrobium alkaliphilum]|uniref:hypothetical protein n=1 Tax=Lacimicrobium alkaliphilum TaxID=1526571 RepID=UPI001C5570A5
VEVARILHTPHPRARKKHPFLTDCSDLHQTGCFLCANTRIDLTIFILISAIVGLSLINEYHKGAINFLITF